MVSLGLKKQLKPDQREFLLNMLIGLCGEENPPSLTEALGLVSAFTPISSLFLPLGSINIHCF